MRRFTGCSGRRTVADVSDPSPLIAGKCKRLVAVVTGDDQLVEMMVADVYVARQPHRVSTADHCDTVATVTID